LEAIIEITRLGVNRKDIATRFLLMGIIAVVGAFSMQAKSGTPFKTSLLWFAVCFPVIAIRQLRLLVQGVSVELSSEGITDHTAGLGLIHWEEIISARKKGDWFAEYVEFEVRDPVAFLGRLSLLKSEVWRYRLRHGFRGPAITSSWVKGGAAAVLAGIRSISNVTCG
jgi:hypothetical protein